MTVNVEVSFKSFKKSRHPEVSRDLGKGFKTACWVDDEGKRVYQISFNPGFGKTIQKMYIDESAYLALGKEIKSVVKEAREFSEVANG